MTDPYANVLFLGATYGPHPEQGRYLGELRPPGNYKKPDTIAAWMAEQQLSRDAETAPLPVVGSLRSVVVLDRSGQVQFAQEVPNFFPETVDQMARDLDRYLASRFWNQVSPLRLYGLGAQVAVRLAVLVTARAGPPGVGAGIPFQALEDGWLIDPYEKVLPAAARKHVEVSGLLGWLGVADPGRLLTSAAGMAEAARQLALRTGMVPYPA